MNNRYSYTALHDLFGIEVHDVDLTQVTTMDTHKSGQYSRSIPSCCLRIRHWMNVTSANSQDFSARSNHRWCKPAAASTIS